MIELLIALFRVAQASLEIALASNAQVVAVLLVGALGAAAVALVVTCLLYTSPSPRDS